IAVFSATLLPRVLRKPPASGEIASNVAAADANTSAAEADLLSPVDEQHADAWAVLTAAASDMGVEEADAAGMGAHVGAVDHEVTHLNQAELKELGRLLQSELKHSGD